MIYYKETIAGNFRQKRLASGLTLRAMADHLGVSMQQIHKYETGRDRIPAERYCQAMLICAGFSPDMDEDTLRRSVITICETLPVDQLVTIHLLLKSMSVVL